MLTHCLPSTRLYNHIDVISKYSLECLRADGQTFINLKHAPKYSGIKHVLTVPLHHLQNSYKSCAFSPARFMQMRLLWFSDIFLHVVFMTVCNKILANLIRLTIDATLLISWTQHLRSLLILDDGNSEIFTAHQVTYMYCTTKKQQLLHILYNNAIKQNFSYNKTLLLVIFR